MFYIRTGFFKNRGNIQLKQGILRSAVSSLIAVLLTVDSLHNG